MALAVLFAGVMALASLPAFVRADSGGPDAYGYTWIDSRFPNPGVAFNWVDGVTGGVDLGMADENCTLSPVAFGFPFRFYGTIYTGAYVCPNGLVDFNAPESNPQYASDYVMPLGADLNPAYPGSGRVYAMADTLSSPHRFIVTWDGTYTYATLDAQTFQLVLYENPAGGDGRILFQYRSLNNPPPHITGIMNLSRTSSLNYTSPLMDMLAVMFIPPGGSPPGDVLAVSGTNLAPATVEPGQRDVAMLRLDLSTPTNTVYVRSVRVDMTGQTPTASDVYSITLWRDTDRDGQLNTSNDTSLYTEAPSGSPPQVVLPITGLLPVVAGQAESLIISFHLPLSAVVGRWIGAGVLLPSYVQVATPDAVSPSGFPFNSYVNGVRTRIVEGIDTLRVVAKDATNPATVVRWQTDVPMLNFTVDADKGAVTITRIDATLVAVPIRPGNVYLGKLYLDTEGDGTLEPGTDALLDRGRFDVTGLLRFRLNVTVIAHLPRTFWIAFDIAPDAIVGNLLATRITSASAIGVAGTKDVVSSDNFPVETPSASVIDSTGPPVIRSRWAITPPVPDGISHRGEYVISTANSRDLGAIGGNSLDSWLIVENDDQFLYVAYDAVGDTTEGLNDSAAIAFQTNRTAFPLAPPDDEFGIGGPMGPFHAVLNTSSGKWQVEDACDVMIDGNHSQLACVEGFSGSAFEATLHRLYEFRIPLQLLEVPLPIPARYTLGIAALSNWSTGIHDEEAGGNATWPLPDPVIPPKWYGAVELTPALPPNLPPTLSWTGEPGFESDGVFPNSGTTQTLFMYRVNYTDPDGDLPALGEPRVHILLGGTEIASSPLSMIAADVWDRNATDGKLFFDLLTLGLCPRTYSYFFTAQDDRGANATPTATLSGPSVICPPAPPNLKNGTVAPDTGTVFTTTFSWSVEYRDPNGDPPGAADPRVSIRKGGTEVANQTLTLAAWIGRPGNFSEGAVFGWSQNLTLAGGDYSFAFLASDGATWVTTVPAVGPHVNPEPSDALLASFLDDAPLGANRGARDVKMFTARLSTGTGFVDVVSLKADLAGSAVDGDVAEVRLYWDVNRDGAITAPDRLLGRGPLSFGTISFRGFFVRVNAGTPEQLIALIDLSQTAVADDRVALRVLDASYIGVLPPDIVVPFASFQTSRVLVNVPPTALDMTADAHPNGTPAILHLASHQPVLAWTFSDPNANDVLQDAYNVSVRTEPSGALIWFRNATGTTDSVAYDGPGLVDGVTYRMDVEVSDGRLWGGTSSLWFRMNSPPSTPVLSAPSDQSTGLGPSSVLLRWNLAPDAQMDVVSYRWHLSQAPDFLVEMNGTTGTTSATVITSGSTAYYWKVEAFDQYEWGLASGTWRFTTMPASGSVRGRVIENGTTPAKPVPAALVRLLNATGDVVATASTNSQGRFAITDVPLGVYELNVTADGYYGNATTVALTASVPDPDIGDIGLDAEAVTPPPPPPPGPDWGAIALWIGLAVAVIAAVGAVLGALALRRRRRDREAPATAEAEEAVEEPTGPKTAAPPAEVLYECPACGAMVSEDATTCPGCGAIFE